MHAVVRARKLGARKYNNITFACVHTMHGAHVIIFARLTARVHSALYTGYYEEEKVDESSKELLVRRDSEWYKIIMVCAYH